MAEASVRAGTATEQEVVLLQKTKRALDDLNKSTGQRQDAGAKGFAEQFEKADIKAQAVVRSSKEIGISIAAIRSAQVASPFGKMIADADLIQRETNQVNAAIKNLFGDGISSANRMSEVMRALARVFSGTTTTTQGMRLALLDVRSALKDVNTAAPSKELATGIQTATEAMKALKGNTKLTEEQFKGIVSVLGPIANQILGIDIKSKEFAQTLRTVQGRRAFLEQLQDAAALGRTMEELVRKQQAALGKSFGTSRFADDLRKLDSAADQVSFGKAISEIEKFLGKNNNLRNALNQTGGSIQQLTSRQKILEGFLSRFGILIKSTDIPTGKFRATLQQLAASMGIVAKESDTLGQFIQRIRDRAGATAKELERLSGAANRVSGGIRRASAGMSQFNELTSIAIQKIIRYRVAFFLMSKAIRGLRDAIDTFKDVQAELANIEKVIDPVAGQMERLKNEAFAFAQGFGESIQNVLNVMKIFAQQGKTFNEILDLTETTLIAAAGANLTTQQAVEALTAATKAYNVSSSATIGIVDKLAAVQANFAITAQDLADAIKLIAAAGRNVGVELDELVGQVTAIGTVTRKSGRNIAQSLKTIFARFERSTTINQFKELGIEIQKTDGTIRPLNQVLIELNDRWDTMTEAQRFAIAQTVAGVRRYTDFLVLMDNFGESLLATKTALEAQGDAQRNAAIELGTFNRQIKAVGASLQEAFEGVAAAGLVPAVQGLLAFAQGVAFVVNEVPLLKEVAGVFTTVTLAVLTAKAAQIGLSLAFHSLTQVAAAATGSNLRLAAAIGQVTDKQTQKLVQETVQAASDLRRIALQNALLTTNEQLIVSEAKALAASVAKSGALTAEEVQLVSTALAQQGYNVAVTQGAVANSQFSASMLGLRTVLKSFFGPVGLISLGVTALAIFGGKFVQASLAAKSFDKSVADVAKNLQKQIQVQTQLNDELEKRLRVNEALLAAYDAEVDDIDQLINTQRALLFNAEKLVQVEPQITDILNEQTGALNDQAAAWKILENNRRNLLDLDKDFRVSGDAAKFAAQEVRDSIKIFNQAIGNIDQESLKVKNLFPFVTDAVNFEEGLDIVEAQIKGSLRRTFGDAVDFIGVPLSKIPEEMREQAQLAAAEFDKQFVRKSADFAFRFVQILSRTQKKELNAAIPEIKESRDAFFTALGLDEDEFNKLFQVDFDASLQQLNRAIASAETEAERRDLFKGFISQTTDLRLRMKSLANEAGDTIKTLTDLEVANKVMLKTGFIVEDLFKVIDKTAGAAEKTRREFEAFNQVAEGTSQIGANLADIYTRVGLGFDRTNQKAAAAEAAFQAVRSVMIKMSEVANRTGDVTAAQFLPELVEQIEDFPITGEEFISVVRQMSEQARGSFALVQRDLEGNMSAAAQSVNEFLAIANATPSGEIPGGFGALLNTIIDLRTVLSETGNVSEDILKTMFNDTQLVLRIFDLMKASIEDSRKALEKGLFERAISQIALQKSRQEADKLFSALRNIGGQINLSQDQLAKLTEAQTESLESQAQKMAKLEFATKRRLLDEDEINKALDDGDTLYDDILARIREEIGLKTESLSLQDIINKLNEDYKRAVKEVNEGLKDEERRLDRILKTSNELLRIRAEETGLLRESTDASANRARISVLERQRDLLEQFKTKIEAGEIAFENQAQAIDDIKDKLGTSQTTAEELVKLFLSWGENTDKLDDKLKKLDQKLKDLNLKQNLFDVKEVIAATNRELETEQTLFENMLSINRKIATEREKIAGAVSGRQARVAAELEVQNLERQIKKREEAVVQNQLLLDFAEQRISSIEDMTEAERELFGIMQDQGLVASDFTREIAVSNEELKRLREQLAKARENVLFTEAIQSIDEYNARLDDSLALSKELAGIVESFEESSAKFGRTVGQTRVRNLQDEIALEERRNATIKATLDEAEAELALKRALVDENGKLIATDEEIKALQAEIATLTGESAILPERIRELQRELVLAKLNADPVFQKMLRDSQAFTEQIEGAAGAVADFFGSLPETINARFEGSRQSFKRICV
jgi:TP901 family phage tail tape measure protein